MPSSDIRPTGGRGAGSGAADPGPPMLKCGHQADSGDAVIVFPANKKRYWCDICRTLSPAK